MVKTNPRIQAEGGRRNVLVRWRTTKKFQLRVSGNKKAFDNGKDSIRRFGYWEDKTFVDSNAVERKFRSEAEFHEYVMAVLVNSGEKGWRMLAFQKMKPLII